MEREIEALEKELLSVYRERDQARQQVEHWEDLYEYAKDAAIEQQFVQNATRRALNSLLTSLDKILVSYTEYAKHLEDKT